MFILEDKFFLEFFCSGVGIFFILLEVIEFIDIVFSSFVSCFFFDRELFIEIRILYIFRVDRVIMLLLYIGLVCLLFDIICILGIEVEGFGFFLFWEFLVLFFGCL